MNILGHNIWYISHTHTVWMTNKRWKQTFKHLSSGRKIRENQKKIFHSGSCKQQTVPKFLWDTLRNSLTIIINQGIEARFLYPFQLFSSARWKLFDYSSAKWIVKKDTTHSVNETVGDISVLNIYRLCIVRLTRVYWTPTWITTFRLVEFRRRNKQNFVSIHNQYML